MSIFDKRAASLANYVGTFVATGLEMGFTVSEIAAALQEHKIRAIVQVIEERKSMSTEYQAMLRELDQHATNKRGGD
jgi:DNA-binding transcriptional MerR regulator